MKVSLNSKFIDNRDMQYTHIQNNSKTICFMFSGAGYTYDKPLFYYATMKLIEEKMDIIQIHYSYDQDIFKTPIEEIARLMLNDVKPIITDVLNANEYDDIIFIGKSVGTVPVIGALMNEYQSSKSVLLTPLLKYDYLTQLLLKNNNELLIVIGTEDNHYNPEKLEELRVREGIKIQVMASCNHSLEIQPLDTLSSISRLSTMIECIGDFIR